MNAHCTNASKNMVSPCFTVTLAQNQSLFWTTSCHIPKLEYAVSHLKLTQLCIPSVLPVSTALELSHPYIIWVMRWKCFGITQVRIHFAPNDLAHTPKCLLEFSTKIRVFQEKCNTFFSWGLCSGLLSTSSACLWCRTTGMECTSQCTNNASPLGKQFATRKSQEETHSLKGRAPLESSLL